MNSNSEKRGIMTWLRDLIQKESSSEPFLTEAPKPEVVTSLISIAAGERAAPSDRSDDSDVADMPEETGEPDEKKDGDGENNGDDDNDGKKSCSYALKRNIVISLREIRKFAEEHQLAAEMVKALLALLAEMAIDALRGKVSGAVLDALLKVVNFESIRRAAYLQGELDGRNARISEEYFAGVENGMMNSEKNADGDGLPHFHGMTDTPSASIFDMAKQA